MEAVGFLSVATGLDIEVATARTGEATRFAPTPVNRALKGDRYLPMRRAA